mmetsp:Transcript_129787/g.277008  ORF Transcript_129787/g.277008 Transcript_129787/m.277008 type:complete len:348 (+) Transcript_129787:170-1213(+)
MEASKTSCFFSCSFTIFSSTVSVVMKRTARTSFVWPIRWARWMACISPAGFHQGSSRKTWLATCKLRPSPPAFREIRITLSEGSVLKAASASSRACIVMPPLKMTHEMPSRFNRNSTSSSIAPNWEKMMALSVGSLRIIFFVSSTSASILVLLWKSWALTFCMMPFAPSFAPFRGGAPAFPKPGRATARADEAASPASPGAVLAGDRDRPRAGGWALAGVSLALTPRFEGVARGEGEEAALRPLALAARPPFFGFASSSPSLFSPSSRSTLRRQKHVGQPTPPDGNCGASAMYARMHSSWKTWPHLATRLVSSPSSSTSSWQSAQTAASFGCSFWPSGNWWEAWPPP